MKHKGVLLTEEDIRELEALAKGIPFSLFVRMILREHIKNSKK